MDSNIITLSSILPQASIPILNTGKLDMGKDRPCFTIEQDSGPDKAGMTDNKADIQSSRAYQQSEEDVSFPQKPREVHNDDESTNKDIYEEDSEKDYLYPESDSSIELLENRDNENIGAKDGYILSESIDQVKDEQLDELKQLLKVDEKLDRIKDLLLEQTVEKSGLKIYSVSVNDGKINIQTDSQIENIENIPEQGEIIDIIKTVIGNMKNGANKSGLDAGENTKQLTGEEINNETKTDILNIKETDKESIIGNKEKYPVIDGKLPALENNSIKDNAKDLISQAKVDESGIKEAFLTGKNSDNDKQTNLAQGIAESSKIRESLHSLNVSKDDSGVQKIEITNLQVSAGQTKSQSESSPDNKADSIISQIASHNNTFATEQNNSSIANVRIVNQTQQGTSEDVSANVGKQILESIHSSMAQRGVDKQITVNLNPPELGHVSIKFQEHGAQLTGLLEVNKTQTKAEIEQALPQIIRNLSDSGINIKRLEVVLTTGGRTEQEAAGRDSFYNQQQQQDFNNPSLYGGNRDMTGFHEWMANNINSIGNPGLGDSIAVEDSIDILI